jgi:outer membrane protein OmpA-like peptidoglycan-associated protein
MRLGGRFDSIGLYAIIPEISFLTSGPGDISYATFGGGVGSFFFGGIILVETLYSRFDSFFDGGLFEVRIGLDLIPLFSSSEGPEAQPPPSPPPPPPAPVVVQPPPQVAPPPVPPAPEPPRAEIRQQQIVINQRIHFDFDSADIRPDSYPILDAVVELFRSHPEIQKVQVQGHADDVGTDEYNLSLSRRRANAVMTYLIQRGIEPARLEAIGFGRMRPLVQGTTEEARATNRRTEFLILPIQGP